ncbi:UDP-N-acetylmuramoyl-tripeptide--D-alanyl-D-alanine ligase [Oligoflexia bacterium]|nr:UDP-N-acetylmuramoyl-tripeptide--D-alanyl-D-alanine ligase [Oligoflexia bacterium]
MAISLTKQKLQEIIGGESTGATERISFQGLEYDSREIKGGELFVALKGETGHGEQYLDTAFGRGASMALVEDAALLTSFAEPERLLVVKDALKAFWQLATWWRTELALPIVAITGSVGKTTVKELVASLLLQHNEGTYSLKSHNNHVGLPYTVCRMSRNHNWGVLEMGMNHAGEISDITKIATPNVAAITNIAPAHIQEFGSLGAIADAKFEIIEGMADGAELILNGDDQYLRDGLKRHDPKQRLQVKYFGTDSNCDAYFSNFQSHGFKGISFDLFLDGKHASVKMGVVGRHTALNATCAALLVKTVFPKITLKKIATRLAKFMAPLMRLNLKTLSEEKRIIDDSYNANPASVAAALDVVRDFRSSGLKVGVILGDMLELGAHAEHHHLEIGGIVADLKPEFVVAIGEFAPLLVQQCAQNGIPHFIAETPDAAAHIARKMDYNVLLVKASRGVGLDKTVATLLEMENSV